MIGAIIGDIAGSTYEFHSIKTMDFPLFAPGSSYTDDSLMSIAVASALMQTGESHDGFKSHAVTSMRQIATKYPCPMGGYGGALKQLSIGCASSAGKTYIHTGGKVTDQNILWENCAEQDTFLEAMADAASTVAKHFAGKIAYVAIMKNLSVDCDCCAVAEDPCMNDVGILSSLDPVALDRACIDLVINSNDPGRDHFMERVNSRHGAHTIEAAEALGVGTTEYELVRV